MTMRPSIIFVVDLLQDVNIIRGLAYLAAREFDAEIMFAITDSFFIRDAQRTWERELGRLAVDVDAEIIVFADAFDVAALFAGRRGIVLSASESSLPNHAASHTVMQLAPPDFLTVTLQHGYECVGFMQNREHVVAHGNNVTFAADVVCGWAGPTNMTSLVASQRPKLYVSGSPTLLQRSVPDAAHPPVVGGMVCENLHSVRHRATSDQTGTFIEIFQSYCDALAQEGRGLTLRPHPGGQFVVKNNTPLAANVTLNNLPIYRVDLARYAYGISAPSSVLLDMLLAEIPVAVWRSPTGAMDVTRYRGLTFISDLADWLAFERNAVHNRTAFLERQRRFLARVGLLTDRAEIYRRFKHLFASGLALGRSGALAVATAAPALPQAGMAPTLASRSMITLPRQTAMTPEPPAGSGATPTTGWRPKRILFVTNGALPTLEIAFQKPLAPLVASGELRWHLFIDRDLHNLLKGSKDKAAAVSAAIDEVEPEIVMFCRYSGPYAQDIVAAARQRRVPVVFNIDDDLLDVPLVLGEHKHAFHNSPERLATVRYLLDNADLVYASTARLRTRLESLGVAAPIVNGVLFSPGEVLVTPVLRPVRVVGYMGFDHAHDLELILPDLVAYLERNLEIRFELFGSIAKPAALDRFGERVREIPPVRGYDDFLNAFAARRWDIGLCPLQPTAFNATKNNNKWVEYTAAGIATIASKGMIYNECCADGCGILVRGADGWLQALERLTFDPEARYHMVKRAQRKLATEYTADRLADQIAEVFALAAAYGAYAGPPPLPEVHRGRLM